MFIWNLYPVFNHLKISEFKMCTGKTQRDGMWREAGGGIGMGNTCKSTADSCQCMAKTTTIKKKKLIN